MKQWVLSVAGIAILSVLADVILPVGQTRKYVKTVVSVVVTAVLAQPILSFATNFNVSYSELTVQESYLQFVEADDAEKICIDLQNVGFSSPTVTFDDSSQSFVVVFRERRTDALSQKAREVVTSSCRGYEVKFYWNNSAET